MQWFFPPASGVVKFLCNPQDRDSAFRVLVRFSNGEQYQAERRAFSPSGQKFAFTQGCKVFVADESTIKLVGETADLPSSVAWSPDETLLGVGGREVTIFDLRSGERQTLPGAIGVGWCPAQDRMALCGQHKLRLTNPEVDVAIPPVIWRHSSDAVRVMWSPDGQKIALYSGWSYVVVVCAKTGATLCNLTKARLSHTEVRWSPDSGQLAVPMGTDVYQVVDATSGQKMGLFVR